jgi:hypothetical protein
LLPREVARIRQGVRQKLLAIFRHRWFIVQAKGYFLEKSFFENIFWQKTFCVKTNIALFWMQQPLFMATFLKIQFILPDDWITMLKDTFF